MSAVTKVENHPCGECGELAAHKLHHEVESMTDILEDVHFDECNYEGDWKGEERGWVASMSCHEYELGCYCAESGRCEVSNFVGCCFPIRAGSRFTFLLPTASPQFYQDLDMIKRVLSYPYSFRSFPSLSIIKLKYLKLPICGIIVIWIH